MLLRSNVTVACVMREQRGVHQGSTPLDSMQHAATLPSPPRPPLQSGTLSLFPPLTAHGRVHQPLLFVQAAPLALVRQGAGVMQAGNLAHLRCVRRGGRGRGRAIKREGGSSRLDSPPNSRQPCVLRCRPPLDTPRNHPATLTPQVPHLSHTHTHTAPTGKSPTPAMCTLLPSLQLVPRT